MSKDQQQARVEPAEVGQQQASAGSTERTSTGADLENLLADAPDALWAELQQLWSSDANAGPDGQTSSGSADSTTEPWQQPSSSAAADETLPPSQAKPASRSQPGERGSTDATQPGKSASSTEATPAAGQSPRRAGDAGETLGPSGAELPELPGETLPPTQRAAPSPQADPDRTEAPAQKTPSERSGDHAKRPVRSEPTLEHGPDAEQTTAHRGAPSATGGKPSGGATPAGRSVGGRSSGSRSAGGQASGPAAKQPGSAERPRRRGSENQGQSGSKPISDSMAGLVRHDSSETGSWSMPVDEETGLFDPGDPGATGAWEADGAAGATIDPDATGAHVPQSSSGGAAATAAHSAPRGGDRGDVPAQLGGYQILKELGRGAMGAVYLARQLSLERDVALKTIRAEMTRNAVFVARFTREAYAAAQLIHHNVVQIYDLGQDDGTQFFSMELIEGKSLSDVVREQGRLDLHTAVGYILQAARGLKYAHDHGMVHRDVKPANLLVNNQGVVKVADLGLVKTGPASERRREVDPSQPQSAVESLAGASDVTVAGSAMGTPAYMAPEQSVDAAEVDHRADIYSLGCTMYVLLTGRPPFEGASALEVMSKHKTEPIVRPEVLVEDIPKEVSDITLKMVAKRPEERYDDLDGVIESLEAVMGREKDKPFELGKEHADLLDAAFRQFYESPTASLRPRLLFGLLLAGVAAAVGAAMVGQWLLFGGLLGLLVFTPLAYFVVRGIREHDYLFEQARELVFTNHWSDWFTLAVGGLVFIAVMVITGLWWLWLVAAGLAIAIAWALNQFVDGAVAAERSWAAGKAKQLLRDLRLQGVEEAELREFVARFSDYHWEEFFEILFGYQAKLAARKRWRRGEDDRLRPKFAAWRDPVIVWIQDRVEARREARQRKHLAELEHRRYRAEGLDDKQAWQRAEQLAGGLVQRAATCRMSMAEASAKARAGDPEAVRQKRQMMLDMLAAARSGQLDDDAGPVGWQAVALKALDWAFGERARFVLGCVLVIGCAFWVYQNNMIQVPTTAAWGSQDAEDTLRFDFGKDTIPLTLPGLPRVVAELFDSFNPGVAGLILVVSSLIRGLRMAIFAFPSAAFVVLAHHLGMPSLIPGAPANLSSMLLGVGMTVFGIFLCGEE